MISNEVTLVKILRICAKVCGSGPVSEQHVFELLVAKLHGTTSNYIYLVKN